MKFRAFYFLLPLLTAVSIFTFCTKESAAVLEEKSLQEQAVGDRGTCYVTVTVNYGSVIVCGTNTNSTQCAVGECFNNPLVGTQTLSAPASAIYAVSTPGSILITDDDGTELSNVTVSTGVSSITTGVGESSEEGEKEFCVDNKCNLTLIR